MSRARLRSFDVGEVAKPYLVARGYNIRPRFHAIAVRAYLRVEICSESSLCQFSLNIAVFHDKSDRSLVDQCRISCLESQKQIVIRSYDDLSGNSRSMSC